MDAARVDPPVIEIEQRADRDGEIDGLIAPIRCMEPFDVLRTNTRRIVIHLLDEPEQHLMFFIQRRVFQIAEDTPNKLFAA